MKVYDLEQGTDEWFQARCGIPTASEFDKIITAGGKASTQAEGYKNKLLAEIMLSHSVQTFAKTGWMERGNELEQEAADYYEMQNNVVLQTVGFCTDDARKYGCSPDRLIGDDGLLEIKCPSEPVMIGYMLKGNLAQDYKVQVQGQLLVTGRRWCDLLAYCPEMPPILIRIERDNGYIMSLISALDSFNKNLEANKQILINKGYLTTKE